MEAIYKVSTEIHGQLGCGTEIHILPAGVQVALESGVTSS